MTTKAEEIWGGPTHTPSAPTDEKFQAYMVGKGADLLTYEDFQLFRLLLQNFNPRARPQDQTLSLCMNHKDAQRGRRIKGKPGRMLRKLFPNPLKVDEASLERIHDEIREKFLTQISDYKVQFSTNFHEIYTWLRADMMNPCTTEFRKSLADSCMRYDEWGEQHPTDMYGSGEFSVAYILHPDTKDMMARALVHGPSKTYGPIYGVSDKVMEALAEHLEGEDNKQATWGSWKGAQLLAIPEDDHRMFGAYLDVEPKYARWDGESETMTIVTDDDGYNVTLYGHEGYQEYQGPIGQCDHDHGWYSKSSLVTFEEGTFAMCNCIYSELTGRYYPPGTETPPAMYLQTSWNGQIHPARLPIPEPELETHCVVTEIGELWIKRDTRVLPDGRIYPKHLLRRLEDETFELIEEQSVA